MISSQRHFRTLASATVIGTLLVILWGAYTRLSGSGDGCGQHWPLCKGALLPDNPGFETIVELLHRTTSGVVFLGSLGLMLAARRLFDKKHLARRAAAWGFFFMCLEALIGAKIVLFGWVDEDASAARIISLSLHLVNTFALLSSLALARWASGLHAAPKKRRNPAITARTAAACFGLLCLTGITGSIAALAHTLYPAASFFDGVQQDFDPMAPIIVRLRISHPLIAVICALALFSFARRIAGCVASESARRPALLLMALVSLQLGWGALTLVSLAPLALTLTHLLLADLVILCFTVTAAAALWEEPEPLSMARTDPPSSELPFPRAA